MEPKEIHVGFGPAHNGGVEVWDWNETDHADGSPKFIAHINDNREVTLLEDNFPIDVVDQIKAVAKADWKELFAIEMFGRDYNPPPPPKEADGEGGIHHVTTDEIKKLAGGDGLILQGCGGDPAEWLKGINETLTEAGILKNDGEFNNIYVFEHEGITNILYPFDNMKPDTLDMGKLAIWRIQTHGNFGGTWHSDYLNNTLGVNLEARNVELESMSGDFNRVPPQRNNGDEIDPNNPPPIVSFGERPSPYRDEGAEGPHPSDAESYEEPTHPISVFIENAHDSNLRGFSVPLPATEEEMQPFLAEMKITDWRNIRIVEVESDIKGLGEKLTDIISDNGADSYTLDELNYLAVRIEGLGELGTQIFSANIEVGRHSNSIAEMINLTLGENINQFDVWPASDEADYGDILVNQFMADEHAIAFNRLKDSENLEDRALAAHIEKLEKHTDMAAFGRTTAKEEGGVFTEQGYLVGGKDDLEQLYKGAQDIPAEHCLLSQSAKAPQRIIKIDDVNITEAIVKLHAVGCRSMEHAANNVKIFLDTHKQLAENSNNYLSNHYILVMNHSDICIDPAMELCKRGSDLSKFAMSMADLATKDAQRTDIKIFAIRVNNAHVAEAEKGRRDLRGDFIELVPHALSNHITRYATMPDRVDALHDGGAKKSYDLFEWGQMLQQQGGDSSGLYSLHYPDVSIIEAVGRYGNFVGSHERMSLAESFEMYLPSINAISENARTAADVEQPFMIRIANEAAKEMLARGDADVYRLTDGGSVKLHAIEAARPMCFAEYKDLAIKQKDSAGLEKWAARKVDGIIRQAECAERIASKNKGEEL